MPTTKYLEQLQTHLDKAFAAARENTERAHARSKANYDKHATVRQLTVGSQALVLLPANTTKATFAWRGPYPVLEKLPNNNYKLQIGRRQAIFHINSLREFHEPATGETAGQSVSIVITEDADEIDGDMPDLNFNADNDGSSVKDVTVGQQLTDDQSAAIYDLLDEYADIFSVTRRLHERGIT